jgi:hypothetical protein
MNELLTKQKKRYVLLFNRIIRREIKKVLIKTPSKLSDQDINEIFDKIFEKKEHYYIPKKNLINIKFNEEEFKTLYKQKKPKVEKEKKLTDKELIEKVKLFKLYEKEIPIYKKALTGKNLKKHVIDDLTAILNEKIDELLALKLKQSDLDRFDELVKKMFVNNYPEYVKLGLKNIK